MREDERRRAQMIPPGSTWYHERLSQEMKAIVYSGTNQQEIIDLVKEEHKIPVLVGIDEDSGCFCVKKGVDRDWKKHIGIGDVILVNDIYLTFATTDAMVDKNLFTLMEVPEGEPNVLIKLKLKMHNSHSYAKKFPKIGGSAIFGQNFLQPLTFEIGEPMWLLKPGVSEFHHDLGNPGLNEMAGTNYVAVSSSGIYLGIFDKKELAERACADAQQNLLEDAILNLAEAIKMKREGKLK